ncbi:hypothetical protein [Ferroacidibacillus organovorans]|uniref:Uncharacterized protein n=1 Tax=Ferroacidibacillus organovorans TaxID=1765683 RepID=A0A1V4EX87_9BACL|nr:hypothetical protein [Ferroacidibacillus organovorans]OPG17364.1 hypothetical protein B2M26_01100 [Ferroacidibacillus organovorans]
MTPPTKMATWNHWVRILVTIGLVTGYFVAIHGAFQERRKISLVANSILLPVSLVWLWMLRSN